MTLNKLSWLGLLAMAMLMLAHLSYAPSPNENGFLNIFAEAANAVDRHASSPNGDDVLSLLTEEAKGIDRHASSFNSESRHSMDPYEVLGEGRFYMNEYRAAPRNYEHGSGSQQVPVSSPSGKILNLPEIQPGVTLARGEKTKNSRWALAANRNDFTDDVIDKMVTKAYWNLKYFDIISDPVTELGEFHLPRASNVLQEKGMVPPVNIHGINNALSIYPWEGVESLWPKGTFTNGQKPFVLLERRQGDDGLNTLTIWRFMKGPKTVHNPDNLIRKHGVKILESKPLSGTTKKVKHKSMVKKLRNIENDRQKGFGLLRRPND